MKTIKNKKTAARPAERRRTLQKEDLYHLIPQDQRIIQPSRHFESRNYSWIWWLIAALLLLFLAGIIGYFVWDYQNGQKNIEKNPAVTAESNIPLEQKTGSGNYQIPLGVNVPSEEQQAAPEIQWLDYQYNILSTTTVEEKIPGTSTATTTIVATSTPIFDFKYPSNFSLIKEDKNVKLVNAQASSTIFTLNLDYINISINDYIKEIDKIGSTLYKGKPMAEVEKESKIQVDGLPALKRWRYLNAANAAEEIVYVFLGNKVVTISLVIPTTTPEIDKFYDSFINTFKFVK